MAKQNKYTCPHCKKSFVNLNRHKCKVNKKQKSENDSSLFVEFRNCKIRMAEAEVLKGIEKLTGRKFVLTHKIGFENRLSYSRKNHRITGLAINKCGF